MIEKCPVCGRDFYIKPSSFKKNTISCCSMECANQIRKHRCLGDSNPNKKYNYDRHFFNEVDTEFKAWFLGWILSDGCINKGGVGITIHERDIDVLNQIRDNFCSEIPIVRKNDNMFTFQISSKEIVNDICNFTNIQSGKKSNIVSFPNFKNKSLERHFLRGYFEGDGCICKITEKKRTPYCSITSNSDKMLEDIQEKTKASCKVNLKNHSISWSGVNALDFLGYIYSDCTFKMLRKYELYQDISLWRQTITAFSDNNIYFQKTDIRAEKPFKSRVSDSGYDLTLIDKIKQNGIVEFYDTGIKVKPPLGYYFDLVPRSSISKSGYILANNIGIIDMSYTGNIIVPLIKIDKNAKDLELPCRLVQLIPRKIQNFEVIEVDSLDETERGEGGFGSSGKF